MGHLAYSFDPMTGRAQEPEGILSTLPALASVMLGLQLGALLRHGQISRIWLTGLLMIFAGWIWSPFFPLNKQLWTSSFVLWTGRLSRI